MKRTFALILAILMALTAFIIVPSSAETYGDWVYSVAADNTVTLTKYNGSYDSAVVVPAEINGRNVRTLGDKLFYQKTQLKWITVNADLRTIGASAFYGCTGLTSITIPSGVTTIGASAFYGCTGLTSITIPEKVTTIGASAFKNCTNVSTLNYNVTGDIYLGSYEGNSNSVFDNIGIETGGVTVTFGENVIAVPSYMFYPYSDKARDNVTKVVFSGTKVKTIRREAFCYCTSLTDITIPDSIATIGSEAFYGCTGLTSITIPEKVTTIGTGAFKNCTNVSALNYNVTGDIYLGSYEGRSNSVFDNIGTETDGVTVTFGENVIAVPSYMFYPYSDKAKDNVTKVVFSGTKVKTIGKDAFCYCTSLTDITIAESVTTIGEEAFYGCTGLTSITIPSAVTTIGSQAFYGCTGFTSITIPEKVTTIGAGAFKNCTYVSTLNYNVTGDIYLGSYEGNSNSVFDNIGIETGGVTVTFGENVIAVPSYMFYPYSDKARDNVTKVVFSGTKVKTIRKEAFCYCSSLTDITIPDSIATIGSEAFYGCTGLTSITIPEKVTTIGTGAFKNCTNVSALNYNVTGDIYLGSYEGRSNSVFDNIGTETDGVTVTFGENAIAVPSYMFYPYSDKAKDNVTKVVFSGTKVKTIGKEAFCYCTSLTDITIAESVTTIGEDAFYGCTGLASIAIPSAVTTIGSQAFYGCTGFTSITIPEKVTTIGAGAFKNCTNVTALNYNVTGEIYLGSYEGNSNSVFDNIGIESDGVTVTFGENVIAVPAYMFYPYSDKAKDNVTKVVFSGTKVKTIGKDAFCYCTSLTDITIPDSIATIGSEAFYGCTGLTSITIPEKVTTIGASAFKNCTNVSALNYNVTGDIYLGSYDGHQSNGVFENIGTETDGVTVTFGENVIAVPAYMFYANSDKSKDNVTKVIFSGTQLKTVGVGAFKKCDTLTSVKYAGSKNKWDKSVEVKKENEPLFDALWEYAEEGFRSGDVNGDGKINAKDVTTLMKKLVGLNPNGYIEDAADFNNDNKINAKDVTSLMKYIVNGGN